MSFRKDMNPDGIVFIIVTILLTILLIIMIVLSWPIKASKIVDPKPDTIPTLGYSCRFANCPSSLICDPSTLVCRQTIGGPCSTYADCPVGSYCSGVCVTGPYGAPGQPCPCDENSECVTLIGGKRICKAKPGIKCTSNDECINNLCIEGICSSIKQNGQTCTENSQCQSRNCSEGVCQVSGVLTGSLGSICNKDAPCYSGLSCLDGICSKTRGIGDVCINDCLPPMICLDKKCSFPTQPNTCQSGVCSKGFSCRDGLCYADIAQACVVNANCLSGKCSDRGSLYYLAVNRDKPFDICRDSSNVVVLGSNTLRWERMAEVNGVLQLAGNDVDVYWLAEDGLYKNGSLLENRVKHIVGTLTLTDVAVNADTVLVTAKYQNGPTTRSFLYQYVNSGFRSIPTSGANFNRVSISRDGRVAIYGEGPTYMGNLQEVKTPASKSDIKKLVFYPEGIAYTDTSPGVKGLKTVYPQPPGEIIDFSLWSPVQTECQKYGNMIIVNRDPLSAQLYLVMDGQQYSIPGFVDFRTRVLVNKNYIYMWSNGSCL